jgi:serine/threonine protein kinase
MARFTSAGSILSKIPGGTPLFQAPEVLSKEKGADAKPLQFPQFSSCEISYQSDVYSLGVVMWSLIMRRYPDHPGAVSMVTPALVADARLRDPINSMLEPDPFKRPRASQLLPILELVPVVSAMASKVLANLSSQSMEAAVSVAAASYASDAIPVPVQSSDELSSATARRFHLPLVCIIILLLLLLLLLFLLLLVFRAASPSE